METKKPSSPADAGMDVDTDVDTDADTDVDTDVDTDADGNSGMPPAFCDLLGRNPAFKRALNIAYRAALANCSVLIVGETGTGKELVARAIHLTSERSQGPMVAINCGAIARELIESELFGHEQGSFTGANQARDGVFVQAHRGTLFLDELGELPLLQQPHLLRVLETGVVRRVGGSRERTVDVRVLAATNRLQNLGTDASRLRADLFHRVATVIVHLPPLRERTDDIPLLVRAFIREMTPTLGQHSISRSTMRTLMHYSWPGNVRQLRQAIQRAMTLCPGELTVEHLLPMRLNRVDPGGPRKRRNHSSRAAERTSSRGVAPRDTSDGIVRPIDLIIRDALLDALETHPSLRQAARSLGMAKSTFADWARRLGIIAD